MADSNCDVSKKPSATVKCEFEAGRTYDFEFTLGSSPPSEEDQAFRQTIFYPRVSEDIFTGAGDVNNWMYLNGPTPTSSTGPGSDHTFGDPSG